MIKHYVAVKTDQYTLAHFEVDEYVQKYIGQLEHALSDERVKDTLFILYPRLLRLKPKSKDETEYLVSSEANKKRLDEAIAQIDKAQELTAIAMSDITPVSLLDLGFTEEYRKPECGEAGYLYYSLYIHDVALLSTPHDDDDGFYIFMDDNTKITEFKKLLDIVTSLRAL